jgi:hypothetical protein
VAILLNFTQYLRGKALKKTEKQEDFAAFSR